MTTYNKSNLKTFFAQGDIPQGSDYANLIDSQVNIAETGNQSMAGPLTTTKLVTPTVSAANLNVSGTVNVSTIAGVSAFSTTSLTAINAVITSESTVPVVINAAGTSQATASTLSTNLINRLQGASDGSATGYKLPQKQGGIYYLMNENAVSANLWPDVGCKINGLSTNVAFSLAATTPYTVFQYSASAYAVK